ncbi:glycosyltransferase family 2 protein [Priestia megaterium]|uniref:glycosyltransferase family 2 protein n=1 Tax=Priestia megaterium TaxID=1404 RepID=UPI0011A2E166|nr:glycosyltransferase family 2 protein [Priestia megaterium]
MISEEKVSIIIPTYKGARCIKRAIDSLLDQTYTDIEIIVVDDNPPNSIERLETEQIIKTYKNKLKYIKHEKNLNGAAARNSGIKVATGEFVGFLDDDDYYLPEKVEMSLKALRENRNCDAVFCGVIITDNKHVLKVVEPTFNNHNMQKKILFDVNMIGTGSNLFLRKSAIDKIEGFDISYYRLQDVEFLVRFFEDYNACWIDNLLIVKARGGDNNVPQYNKLFKIKQQFYNDFSSILRKFEKDDLERFYMNEYSKLLSSCFGKESSKNLFKAKQDLEKYRSLKPKERISIILSLLGSSNNNAYLVIKSILALIVKPFRSVVLKHKYGIGNKIFR